VDDDKKLLEIVRTFLEDISTIRAETAISAQIA
jgi:hypothetical protein